MRTNSTFHASMAVIVRRVTGASLLEYGLIVGLIAVVAIAAVSQLGAETNSTFCTVQSRLADVFGDPIECATDLADEGGGGESGDDGIVFDTTGLSFENMTLPEGATGTRGCPGRLRRHLQHRPRVSGAPARRRLRHAGHDDYRGPWGDRG